MERVRADGPELAKHASTMVSTTVLQEPSAAARHGDSPTSRSLPRSFPGELLLPLAYYSTVAAVLAWVGYPAWRIAVLGVAAVVPPAVFLCTCASAAPTDPRRCVNADPDKIAWWVVLAKSKLLVLTGLTAAVTGGVHSPLLVTLTSAYAGASMVAGDRRPTRLLLGATALAVGMLAVLPPAWTGPDLPGPVHAALVVASFLGVGTLLASVHARMRAFRADFLRARAEMASEALTRAQSLEQIGSKLAHELKNPLTGVKALVQLGLRNPAESPSRERLEVVEREVARMQEILQNYLSFTRPLQEMTPTRVKLGSVVSDALGALSARADDARVRLYTQGDATLEADPRRLKEALLNLVANAIEATPPGGEVAVEVQAAADEAEIVVRDTGRGMPVETLRRIGTPFFTTRDNGTGLGVVLARSVIAQHGGSLRYQSEPGKGTQVRVALPGAPRGARHVAGAAGR
jgi:two-component system, NtrC family, sensor histidine kinase HydH